MVVEIKEGLIGPSRFCWLSSFEMLCPGYRLVLEQGR